MPLLAVFLVVLFLSPVYRPAPGYSSACYRVLVAIEYSYRQPVPDWFFHIANEMAFRGQAVTLSKLLTYWESPWPWFIAAYHKKYPIMNKSNEWTKDIRWRWLRADSSACYRRCRLTYWEHYAEFVGLLLSPVVNTLTSRFSQPATLQIGLQHGQLRRGTYLERNFDISDHFTGYGMDLRLQ